MANDDALVSKDCAMTLDLDWTKYVFPGPPNLDENGAHHFVAVPRDPSMLAVPRRITFTTRAWGESPPEVHELTGITYPDPDQLPAFTVSNGVEPLPLTFEAIEKAMAEVRAMPRVENDITVSPDLLEAVRELFPPAPDGVALPSAMRLHVDARLPERTWHKGRPR